MTEKELFALMPVSWVNLIKSARKWANILEEDPPEGDTTPLKQELLNAAHKIKPKELGQLRNLKVMESVCSPLVENQQVLFKQEVLKEIGLSDIHRETEENAEKKCVTLLDKELEEALIKDVKIFILPKVEWWTRFQGRYVEEYLKEVIPIALQVQYLQTMKNGMTRVHVRLPSELGNSNASLLLSEVDRILPDPKLPSVVYTASEAVPMFKPSSKEFSIGRTGFITREIIPNASTTIPLGAIGLDGMNRSSGKVIFAYEKEELARAEASASGQFYGWSMFQPSAHPTFRWFVGTQEMLKEVGVTAPLDPSAMFAQMLDA